MIIFCVKLNKFKIPSFDHCLIATMFWVLLLPWLSSVDFSSVVSILDSVSYVLSLLDSVSISISRNYNVTCQTRGFRSLNCSPYLHWSYSSFSFQDDNITIRKSVNLIPGCPLLEPVFVDLDKLNIFAIKSIDIAFTIFKLFHKMGEIA